MNEYKWCSVCYGITRRLLNGKCEWWREHKRLTILRNKRRGI